jgi:hypothetical protein
MEVILGFAVGYWIGTRHGRQGLDQALDSARAIWESPETRNLVREGLSALQAAAPVIDTMQNGRRDTGIALIRGVVDEIIERRFDRRIERRSDPRHASAA